MRNTIVSLFVSAFLIVSCAAVPYCASAKEHSGFASTSKTQFIDKSSEFSTDTPPNPAGDPNAVLDVRVTGNVQIGAKDIIKIIKTRQGRPFSEAALEEDKRALMQKGWFIDVKPRVEKTSSGYIVTFQFIERSISHYVKIVGNHAHTKKVLEEEANLKPGDALDPIAVQQAKERIEQYYKESGYYRVYVEVKSGDQIGDRGVVFLISEGPKQRILDVEFEGNQIASSARLKTLINSKPGWFFWINSEFTRPKLDEDIETLTAYYRKLGFFYAKIDRVFVETDGYTGQGQNRCWVKVKFVIDEGPRCRVRNIRFGGNHVFDEKELLETMKLPKERYFNQDMLEADMNRLKEKYGDEGYVFTVTEPDPRIDEDYVDLVINLKEGPRCYLQTMHIEIVGNDGSDSYTKWHPILNRSSLKPGDILRTSEINASRRRLMASQLFNANPTQGAIPEFIFDYPEEAEKDEQEQGDEDGSPRTIRGQVSEAKRPVLFEATSSEEELSRFAEFFQIKSQKPTVPAAPQNENRSSQWKGQGGMPYTPPLPPVKPVKLSMKNSSNSLSVPLNQDIYRGQTFTVPRVAPYSSPAPQPVTTQQLITPNSGTRVTNLGSIAALPNPSSFQSNSPAYQFATPQPAVINYPVSSAPQVSSTGPYGTTYYPTTAYQSPAQSVAQYRPPTDITPAQYSPNSYLSPQSTGTNVGNGVLYNQSIIFTQHKIPDSPETKQLILGNPYPGLAENSTVRIDPNARPGVSPKIYPADGRWVVQETRTGQLMMSVAVSSDSGLMGRFVVEEQNFDILNLPKGFRLIDWKNAFRGKGQRFRIEAVPGTEVQRYSTSWETPYLFDLDYSLGVSGFYYGRYYDEWYENRSGGNISFGKLWTPDFSTRLILGGQEVYIHRPMLPVADLYNVLGHHPMWTVGLEASHDTRDSEYMPTEGHILSANVEQVLGDYRFVRGGVDFKKYFMLRERPDRSGRWVLGLRTSLNLSEKSTPIYERYFGGGFTSLRGFEFRGVSPRDANGSILGGCMEFYNSAELVFPITADDMVRGSFFIDTGTIEKSIKRWEDDYRVSLGFGLRLTIPMMGPAPIALDFAFPVSKGRGDERQVFSFNVGFMR